MASHSHLSWPTFRNQRRWYTGLEHILEKKNFWDRKMKQSDLGKRRREKDSETLETLGIILHKAWTKKLWEKNTTSLLKWKNLKAQKYWWKIGTISFIVLNFYYIRAPSASKPVRPYRQNVACGSLLGGKHEHVVPMKSRWPVSWAYV